MLKGSRGAPSGGAPRPRRDVFAFAVCFRPAAASNQRSFAESADLIGIETRAAHVIVGAGLLAIPADQDHRLSAEPQQAGFCMLPARRVIACGPLASGIGRLSGTTPRHKLCDAPPGRLGRCSARCAATSRTATTIGEFAARHSTRRGRGFVSAYPAGSV